MARTQYPDELKAVAMAALLSGQSVNTVADKYKIPRGTLKSWAARERNALRGDNSVVTHDQRERIGHLIINNIEAMLETTEEILDVVTDKEWLKQQSASEVAVLFGVISDKTYRLLEALPDPEPHG
jgi:transposase-like protein